MQKVMVLTASTRPGRVGPKITEWFKTITDQRHDMEFDYVDLLDFNLPMYDEPEHPMSGHYVHEHTKNWSKTVDKFDAFVMVTPEYNHGYPAAIKNAIDYLYHEWHHKPVGFVGYGVNAGVRSVEQLRQVVLNLQMVPVNSTPHVGFNVFTEIDELGNLIIHEGKASAAKGLLDELKWWSETLTPAREKSI